LEWFVALPDLYFTNIGQPIGIYVQSADDVAAFENYTTDDAPAPAQAAPKDEKPETTKASEPADTQAAVAQESQSTGERLETSLDRMARAPITPAAKELALEKGVAIGQVKGTGRGGQITKQDIEKFKPAAGPAAESFVDTPASSMRKTIASRLTQSMQQSPHYFVSTRVSVSKLLKLRAALNADAKGAYKLSVNDLLIKAVALAALKVPAANSSWRDDGAGNVTVREHKTADVCVAVATPVGLVTPIVRNANSRGLADISADIRDLGKRARDGKLKPEEYQGGSITISNMGMNPAVERFTAVINPPQAAIIAVGTVRKVAVPEELEAGEEGEAGVVWDEQIVLTGSFDHKVVDGAVGGEFMRELKEVLENPLKFML
jgi:pyruvate dehydrogenase E2 component (dihydrolipoamide acetyltransferase)